MITALHEPLAGSVGLNQIKKPANLIRLLSAIGLAVLVTACATTKIDLPPVTDSVAGKRLPGKIIWRDLLTNDPAASQRFYGELFGWEFEPVGRASGLQANSSRLAGLQGCKPIRRIR